MSATRTPAPWTVATPPHDPHAHDVFGANGSQVHRGYWGREADARLIAASPRMLEALKVTAGNIRSLMGPCPDVVFEPYRVWLEVVEAAIAEAEPKL